MNKQSEHIILSEEIKTNVCETFNNKCVNCQTTFKKKNEIHHSIPLAAGGSNNEVANFQSLCCSCHKEKSKIIETESS